MKIAIAQLNLNVGDLGGNQRKILDVAQKTDADLIVFPESTLTGYPPEDLVLKKYFQNEAMLAIEKLAEEAAGCPAMLVGGLWAENGDVYNSAFLIDGGKIIYTQHKYDLPNYGVFDEKRVFSAGKLQSPIDFHGVKLGIIICEDMWNGEVAKALKDSDILLSINASPFELGKREMRYRRASGAVKKAGAPIIYVNQMCGQDDLVFDGGSFALNVDGEYAALLPECEEQVAIVEWSRELGIRQQELSPLLSKEALVYMALVTGLRDYVEKNNFPGVLLGLSGGIDSALSAAVAVDALGADKVHAVMIPSKFTSDESLHDAAECAERLGISLENISIEEQVATVENSLSEVFAGTERGIAEENIQSRMRGLLLMAMSNKFGYMVLSTGNKSEYSVGYATLYGDMCGGYNVLKDVYKTFVYRLSEWRNSNIPNNVRCADMAVIPGNIITKAPTAELREDQKDSDSLPPYDMLDAVLHMLIEEDKSVDDIIAAGHDESVVQKVTSMLYGSEYKRRQSAPGVKISPKFFGRDRRYPITNGFDQG